MDRKCRVCGKPVGGKYGFAMGYETIRGLIYNVVFDSIAHKKIWLREGKNG